MTFDDFHTPVGHSQFVGADSKSGITFAPSNDPEAQDSCNVRIITVEIMVIIGNIFIGSELESRPCLVVTAMSCRIVKYTNHRLI